MPQSGVRGPFSGQKILWSPKEKETLVMAYGKRRHQKSLRITAAA